WNELTEEERRVEAREMELYAAMVENLDHQIGRLLAYLEELGELDNTLVVFMSDNGAAGADFYYDSTRPFREFLQARYDNAYENMGRPGSWISYGVPWAEAGTAPFRLYKTHATQCGVLAPLIATGPGVAGGGTINRAFATAMDIAPTFLEIAGAEYPSDGSVRPMLGESMVDVLTGEANAVHADDYAVLINHRRASYLRRGDWKLISLTDPTDPASFGLFNVAEDPGETTDLRTSRPDMYEELIALWQAETERLGIVLIGR
ncbi:MAG: sulfatase-like hydrolase/transferase, partial [Rhodothermales bacterium]|nr:sulfatase-like hydrolase/transferase [Rhodothermales bacterium]